MNSGFTGYRCLCQSPLKSAKGVGNCTPVSWILQIYEQIVNKSADYLKEELSLWGEADVAFQPGLLLLSFFSPSSSFLGLLTSATVTFGSSHQSTFLNVALITLRDHIIKRRAHEGRKGPVGRYPAWVRVGTGDRYDQDTMYTHMKLSKNE